MTNADRSAAVREAAAWIGVAAVHLACTLAFSQRFAAAWLDVPLLAVLLWAARRGRVSWSLPLCMASALCYLLCEPAVGASWPIWLAVVPQFAVVARERRLRVLAAQGIWTGWIVATGIYAWILPSAALFFDANAFVASPFYFATTLLVAVQLAVFLPLLRFFADRTRVAVGIAGPPLYALVEHFLSLPTPIALPLGLTRWPLFLQTMEIAGIAGTTLLIVGVSGAIHEAIAARIAGDRRRCARWLVVATVVFAVQACYGIVRFGPVPPGDPVRVAAIQPISPGKVSNSDSELQEEIARTLLDLSREAIAPDAAGARPDVLFWPEGAAAFASRTPQFNAPYMRALEELQRETPISVVVQNIEFFRDPATDALRYYNAVSVVQPVGAVEASAHKNLLMPFGEYLPLEDRFPVLREWFPGVRSVAAGESPTLLGGPRATFGPIVCYEVLSASYVRRLAGEETGYLAIFTNDAWYGERQQPHQHMAFAILRAVENRKPVVRATNSGISALIRADGAVDASLPVGERGTMRGAVVPSAGRTPYNILGDWLARWVLAPAFVVVLGSALVRGRRRMSPGDSA